VVGGLLGEGGTVVGVIGTTIRDVAQQHHEKAKRRADKFEELVAALYEFDHWLNEFRKRNIFGHDSVPETVSPFAKLQSISAVSFPQFNELIVELDLAANRFPFWMLEAGKKRIAEDPAYLSLVQRGVRALCGKTRSIAQGTQEGRPRRVSIRPLADLDRRAVLAVEYRDTAIPSMKKSCSELLDFTADRTGKKLGPADVARCDQVWQEERIRIAGIRSCRRSHFWLQACCWRGSLTVFDRRQR
jgi:hypothetical protein